MIRVNSTAFKLAIPFALLVTLLLGLGWVGLYWMARAEAEFENAFQDQWAHVKLATEALQYSDLNYRITTQILLTPGRC